ncbi:hypothetical protein DFH07DRAFT_823998 [Mycena maculata]|uniref:G domain-containing protein n=1 Tax=Mycena maculata TaxID=230809 RepID=A0AAD7IZ87_9AGAR|nr:hypothetical protein DFH07DRAFT_823998 [Mycena maculata]
METPPARTRPLPDLRFRVLVAGRANAGKTSILQRVCETTESPEIRRVGVVDYQEVWEKIDNLDPTPERGKHDISDELTFTNHTGYVFHDSGGFECGGKKELEVVQDFIRERSRRRNLRDRVHAIWYCIPMDSERPMFDIDPLHEICPDKNVPVIPVFTKYDAFKLEVRWRLEDDGNLRGDEETQCEAVFKEQYLNRLRGVSKFVRLEGMDEHGACCNELIMTTMDALNNGTVTMMLLAAQRGNLELNVGRAVRR